MAEEHQSGTAQKICSVSMRVWTMLFLQHTMKIQNPATEKERATEHTMPARIRNPSNEDMPMQSK